jgi:hypothetical protein
MGLGLKYINLDFNQSTLAQNVCDEITLRHADSITMGLGLK